MQRQSKKMVIIDLAPAYQTLLCEMALYKVLNKELEDTLTTDVMKKLILLMIEHYLREESMWAKLSSDFETYVHEICGENTQAAEKIFIVMANIWFHDYIRRFDEFWVDLRWVIWDIKPMAANHVLIDIDGDYRIREWEASQTVEQLYEYQPPVKEDSKPLTCREIIQDYCLVRNPKTAAYGNIPEQEGMNDGPE